jgi:hypothetical protein
MVLLTLQLCLDARSFHRHLRLLPLWRWGRVRHMPTCAAMIRSSSAYLCH